MKNFLLIIGALFSTTTLAGDQLVFFGTYTRGGESEGIYVSKFNDDTGKISAPELAAKISNPSFLTIHPQGKLLFAVSEDQEFGGQKSGSVSSFKVDSASGKLELINTVATDGGAPCHISTDSAGKCLLIANYTGGSTACIKIGDDGTLSKSSFIQHEGSSILKPRQAAPHAHSANPGPHDKFAFVADLGMDEVLVYRLDPANAIIKKHSSAKVKPGSGPRHFAFHPDGEFAYVINEITLTVTAFKFNADAGKLTEIQALSSIPVADRDNLKGLSTAEIQVHPSGKFVYGSNRGHDTIAVFSVADDGTLTLTQNAAIEGKTPRNFGIDATGKWLLAAGQNSGSVAVFSIDQQTGKLKFTGDKIEVGRPVCVKFLQR